MKILFISLLDIRSINDHNIYTDLMREFSANGHDVYIISPVERRQNMKTQLLEDYTNKNHRHLYILKLKTGNIQKTNIIEKGISTILIEYQLIRGVKKYFNNIKFDLVLYSTPPITLLKPILYIKKRDNAKTYLMLKDIFPQNAVDLGMLSTYGLKGLLYKYFRSKEKKLYKSSDRIGCMSQANVNYILKNNPEIEKNKVEVCPNSIEIQDINMSSEEKFKLREKYGIPKDKIVFVYGGNLGKPQGIPFVIDCLRSTKKNEKAFFLIVGDGTEYDKLQAYFDDFKPQNMKLLKRLPKDDYDRMIAACDVGMIFLDYRFTIPNFPSRLLSYMQASLPVLACTDPNTDIGKVIVDGGFGWWCKSDDVDSFKQLTDKIVQAGKSCINEDMKNSYKYLTDHYMSKQSYKIIMQSTDKGE